MKPSGIFMSTGPGPHLQNLVLPLLGLLGRGKRVVFAPPKFDPETVRHLAELLASGQLTPVIYRRYPLEQIVEAYRFVETGQKLGNVVIDVAGDGGADATASS